MDPLLLQAHRELAIGDAYDDALNSKTAFQLGDPSLSMPMYSAPQLSYAPTAAPAQYGPPLSAAPSSVQKQVASAAAAYAPQALAALQKRGKPGAAPATAKAPPSFLMSEAFLGLNWATVIGSGSAILLTGIASVLLIRNAKRGRKG